MALTIGNYFGFLCSNLTLSQKSCIVLMGYVYLLVCDQISQYVKCMIVAFVSFNQAHIFSGGFYGEDVIKSFTSGPLLYTSDLFKGLDEL